MPRETRMHIDDLPEGDLTPKYLTKQKFGQRVFVLMKERGWNQSELARQADLPRDTISTYIRAKSLPSPTSLQKLAKAFGMAPSDLLPNVVGSAIEADVPSVEMRVSTAAPDHAWLRINRLLPMSVAVKIISIINDAPADTN